MRATARTMLHRIPITKARVRLGELAKRVYRNKEYFILEKDGLPVIGMMGADELEDYLDVRDSKIQARIRKGTEEFLAGKSRPMEEFLAERSARPSKRAKRRSKR